MKLVNSFLFAGAVLGCGGRQSEETASNQPYVCAPPNCCVPVKLSASNVRFYEDLARPHLALVVERVDTAGATNGWSTSVSVTTASGEALQCDYATGLEPTHRYVMLNCEVPGSLMAPACGRTISLDVRIRSSSTPATGNSGACDGSELGTTLTYTVPFECPNCGGGDLTGTSCDLPLFCYDGWNMPCECLFDSATGKGTWNCAIS